MASTHERVPREGLKIDRPVEVSAAPTPSVDEGPGGLRLTEPEWAYLLEFLGPLTDRERQVVKAVCAEGSNEDAAARLHVTLATLRTHLMKVNQKLGTSSKTDVVRMAADRVIRGYRAGEIESAGGAGAEAANQPSVRARAMRASDSSGF